MGNLGKTFGQGGKGGKAVKFEEPGDSVVGVVTAEPEIQQQTDFDTGQPAFYDSGQPKTQIVFTLKVETDDDNDNGERRLFVAKQRQKKAIFDALKAEGVEDTAEIAGGKLYVKFTGRDLEWTNPKTGKKPRKDNAPMLWTAKFKRGSVPVAEALGQRDETNASSDADEEDEPPF